jgi:hypothetical protein
VHISYTRLPALTLPLINVFSYMYACIRSIFYLYLTQAKFRKQYEQCSVFLTLTGCYDHESELSRKCNTHERTEKLVQFVNP